MKQLVLSTLLLASLPGLAQLPSLTLDKQKITVSGLSSGGYMAAQLLVAHSDRVQGAGIIAAGPVYCAENSLMTALDHCVNKTDSPIPIDALVDTVRDWAEQQKIAPLEHLENAKVWLFHGTLDQRVIAPVTNALATQLQRLAPTMDITFIDDMPANHGFPTKGNGSECGISEAPFIADCDFNGAEHMMSTLVTSSQPSAKQASGQLYTFSQQDLSQSELPGMADDGYLYVPATCQQGQTCKVHISLHGCNQFAEADNIGKAYVTLTGLNEWADNNKTVVLYPQTKASNIMPFNPQGCWDWWGYTGEEYATQGGQQIRAIMAMLNNL